MKRWTYEDVARVVDLKLAGHSYSEIAAQVGRSAMSVRKALMYRGLSGSVTGSKDPSIDEIAAASARIRAERFPHLPPLVESETR